jgi:hypothetical protein
LFLLLSAPRLHHQYRDEEKLLVLEEGKQLHNMSAAARNHHIPISTVMGWEAEIHQGHPPGHVRAEGGGRHPTLTNEQEELLLAFIQDRRKQHLMVGVSDVCNKAIELHKDPKFKASYHWANDFLKKHHLALHLTHSIHKTAALPVGQNMVLPQSILIQQMWEVSRFLRNRFGLDSAHIANADETHVPFESHPVHCIDEKNPQEPVSVVSEGHEKSGCTVLLCVLANGTKLPPLVLFRGKTEANVNHDAVRAKRILVANTPKGFMNENVYSWWMEKQFAPKFHGDNSLLIHDCFGFVFCSFVCDASRC